MEKNILYELTNPQKNIYFMEQYFKNTAINNICGSLIIKQEVDLKLLNSAINHFIKNNDSFKLRFTLVGSEIKQYFTEDKDYEFEIININNVNQVKEYAKKMVSTPFDLFNSRIFDFKLFKLSNDFGGFIVNVHHIISDAATFSLMGREIIQIYSKLLKNEIIIPKTYSYIDYINSEKEYLKSSRFQKDKTYWNDLLTPLPEIATIGPNNSTNNINDIRAKRKEFILDEKLVDKIKDYCTQNKISFYNFLVGIYSIYIGRINNMDIFTLGTPVLNRKNFAERHTSGMFISTSLLKIDMSNNPTFAEFVKNIAINSMKMLRHQKYNYQYIIEDIRAKDNTIANLYDILISYQITQATDKSLDVPYSTKWYGTDFIGSTLEIHFHDNDDTHNLLIEYDYQIAKLSCTDIINMHNRILNIISQVLKNSNIEINNIDIVTPDEKNELIYNLNETDLKYDKNIPIIKYFEKQAELIPDEAALIFAGKKMTYKELNEKANSLAYELRANGVTNNTIIGIMAERSFEVIIAILAVLKSGGCYIPIDPEYPQDRISYMLSDSKAAILLTNNNHSINTTAKIINIKLDNNIYKSNKENIKNISKPEDLSYLIYTSGSTGIPKGVMLTQKNLSNFYHAMKSQIKYLKDGKKHNIISTTTVSFDIFIFETIISLSRGLTLFMTNENEQKITSKLEQIIKENKIEIIQTTPSVMKFHLNSIKNKKDLKSLKYIMLAGEPLSEIIVNKLKEIIPGVTVYNGYGPSETTIFSSVKDVSNIEKITIGRPIANTQIYILDRTQKILPQGIIGEIYISGDGVGKGYINKKEQTEKIFIKNPFKKDKIMYKTGDLGAFDKNGEIICYGRIDNQVKIKGLRIELEEIEKQLLSIYNISNAIVIKKEINGKDVLCAYYTPKGPVDEDIVKTILQNKLPQYMLPQFFIKLEKIPYTPNGKIDKKALPMPKIQKKHKEKLEIRNNIDKELMKIIGKMLNAENINLSDTILDLGGDSLTAITLSTKILSKFNVEINIKDILSKYTIKDISKYIKENQSKNISKIKIKKAPEQEVYPLSSAQKRIYYHSKMIGENNTVYNMPGGILVNGILDKERIKKVFEKIIERHSTLRTAFILYDDDVAQKVYDNINFEIPIYQNKEREIKEIINNFPIPFELEKAPLIRIELHYIENKKTLMLFDAHHIIMDGTSINNLIIEFNRIYNGYNLKKIPIQYKDYAMWENEFNKSKKIKEYEKYWVNKFKDAEFLQLNLPYDYKISEKRSYKGNRISNIINEKEFRKIERYAKKIGASPYMLFISAFFILLYKYTGQEKIILGSPITNRNINETKRMIGMFVNNIVVKGNVNPELTFQEFLDNIKEQVLDDLSNQPYPFDMLIKKLGIKGDNTKNPLFDIMFTYQNKEENIIKIGDKECQIIEIDNNIAKFNLSLEVKPKTHTINIEYCTDLFKKQTIERLFEHYMNIIKCILNNKDIKIKDISIISEIEKNKILHEFNNVKLEYPKQKTLVQLFKEQVEKSKNMIAVKCGKNEITYDELDKKSNYLSNKLLQKGIKPGNVIGINLNRSIELIIAMLATLKVGGIYMPMYIGYPKERLEYMLKNSDAKMLIYNKENNLDFCGIKEKVTSFKTILEENKQIKEIMATPDDIAYIIYTSGSTGKPKGVQIEHKNLINFIYTFKNYYNNDITQKDKFLASTNISFDVSIWEIFLPILNGSTLVLYEEEIIQNIFTYTKSIEEDEITGIYIPPNILEDVYNILKDKENIKINKILVGVEPIRKNVLNKYYKLNEKMIIVNGYGPTETTICCTALKYEKDVEDGIVSIGKPLKNNNIYILSKDKNIQPIGISGEIYVTGEGVGKGYINKKAETEKNFLENTFDNNSKKMYKTGDIAKWNEDGTINFIGRNDSQVKISGHRIELSEINHTVMEYPNIIKSFTTTYKKGERTYIVVYYIAEKEISSIDLMTFLKQKLAEYMIPNFIIQLNRFPLTPNGKIDKEKLPTNFGTKAEYIPPRNEFEKQIAEIFKKLFLLKKVGIDDNFFEIGGDSLTAIKFQIEALNLGLKLTYSDIFSNPTIRMLSERKNKKIVYKIDKNYDYTKINKILSENSIDKTEKMKKINCKKKINNVLLLGVTGFLGAHILEQLILVNCNKIYCIVREKSSIEPEERVKKIMEFYFGDKYNNLFGRKIIVVNGDITDKKLGQKSNEEYERLAQNVDCIIHTAANVKHYGNFKSFNDTNIEGTINVMEFCKKFNKKLYYISTLSVSGNIMTESENGDNIEFRENEFYIGQDLNNVYVYTKFEAEKKIFEAIDQGLDACVLRVGNMTNRYSDGKFQINVSENAFINRIKSVLKLGVIQKKIAKHELEFTPVDSCAKAIIKIMESNPKFTVFHLYNNNLIGIKKVLEILNTLGEEIRFVSDDEFKEKINLALKDPILKNDISGIITDLDENKLLNLINYIIPNCDFTNKYLQKIGFKWPKIDETYIKKYIEYFKNIKYI